MLERRFQEWDFRKNVPSPLHENDLCQAIWILFYHIGQNDEKILETLTAAGYEISAWG
jgi:hypothetical protein